ncbi:MAG: serine/threonine-protein kinase, partial [Myxococcota bacterium]
MTHSDKTFPSTDSTPPRAFLARTEPTEQATGPTQSRSHGQSEVAGRTLTTPTGLASNLPAALGQLTSGTRVGHYELIRELGRGGMGVVFLARDTRLARQVAIKFLHAQNAQVSAQLLSEARATARCRHENIVVIYDVGEFQGSPFMVLEYLRGQTLHELTGGSPMSVPRALELMVPVARALVRAHEHGIVHRDLKPANIFVTDRGVVKVLDFGIAKILLDRSGDSQPGSSAEHSRSTLLESLSAPLHETQSSHLHGPARGSTISRGLLGTLPYMSPEQMRGEVIDERADIWTVGIILYKMLLGHHPLSPPSPSNLFGLADGSVTIPRAQAQLPGLGPITAVIDRCITAARDRRMADAHALLDALEACQPARHALRLRNDQNPFIGLAAFQEGDSDRFFGRSQEITGIVAQLR